MATFSVLIITAPPPHQGAEAGGAFVKIDGREAMLRSVELFLNRENVKQIQVAFLPDNLEEGKRKYGGHLSFSGVKVISAGPRWIDQMAAATAKIAPECTHVIVHDAARPAVPYSDIEAVMEAAEKSAIAALATPVRATLVEVDEGFNALGFYPPGQYMQLLTPVVYKKEKFAEAAKGEPHASNWTLVKGSPLNVRVGGSGDAALVKTMIALMPKPKIKPPSSPFEEAQW